MTAQRLALHEVGRLRAGEVVEWARRAVELAGPDLPVREEARALLGLGLTWQGLTHEPVRAGSGWIAVWSAVQSACANFVSGAWDDAAEAAEHAVSLLQESGHDWLRPLARLAAVSVPAARGEWAAAEEHARAASARPGDYPLMVVAAGVARALVPAARGDHEAVLRALAPVVQLAERDGVDEPEVWPWHDLYADALVTAGHLTEAEVFLAPREGRRRRGDICGRRSGWHGRVGAWRRHGGVCRSPRRPSVGRPG